MLKDILEDQWMDFVQHTSTAEAFLDASDEEFAKRDFLQASEKLWGAAAHATMALAQKQGKPTGSHRKLRRLIQDMARTTAGPDLRAGFAAAEKVHANFYHDFIDYEDEWEFTRDVVRDYVQAVLRLAEDGTWEWRG